jgi:hypothetical protein
MCIYVYLEVSIFLLTYSYYSIDLLSSFFVLEYVQSAERKDKKKSLFISDLLAWLWIYEVKNLQKQLLQSRNCKWVARVGDVIIKQKRQQPETLGDLNKEGNTKCTPTVNTNISWFMQCRDDWAK